MTELPYSNREILAMFEKHNSILTDMSKTLKRIEENTEDTQTRVEKLELRNADKDGQNSVVKYVSIGIATSILGYLAWLGFQIFELTQQLSRLPHI